MSFAPQTTETYRPAAVTPTRKGWLSNAADWAGGALSDVEELALRASGVLGAIAGINNAYAGDTGQRSDPSQQNEPPQRGLLAGNGLGLLVLGGIGLLAVILIVKD